MNDDRTQFTDFTPTKVDDNHIQYSLEELKHLSMAASFNSNLNTTVLIQYYSETELNNQLDSILLQSFIPSSVLVVCSRNETAMINRLIQEKEQELHLYDTIHAIEATSTKGYWFSGIEQSKVLSDYVIIMDKGVLPGEGYFDLMLRLLQTSVFEHALIGTESPSCQQTNEKARYVKSLDSVWVLRREWYLTLAESKQKTSSLSQTLYSRFQIPSIQLPRLMDQQKLLGKTNSKNDGTEATICQDKNEGPIMFFMDNQSSAAFEKLVCEFGEKMQVIHIVDTVDSNIPMLPSCSFEQNAVYIHHTINQIKNDFNNMINQLSPRVVIYEQNENKVDFKNELLLSTTAASKVPTFIQLPRMKDTSIVSWMTDLSVEALERKLLNLYKRNKELNTFIQNGIHPVSS